MNAVARFLGFILNINHSLDRNFNTIVISKYVGLGSIIQATPLIQTLREKFPNSQIVFVSTKSNSTILNHIPEIDNVITVSDKNIIDILKTTCLLLFKLWKIKPELYIDLEFYSNYSSIITTFSKATNRLGFFKQDKKYRKGIYNYLVPFSINEPIAQTYLQFATLVGCKNYCGNLKIETPKISLSSNIEKKIGLINNQKYIVINPNASDLRLERRWPKQSFVQIISHLIKKYPHYKIVLVGNEIESNYVNEILTCVTESVKPINSAGKLSLEELIFLISDAELMITNDTGPMHIAFALHTKTIALFGPCSPSQYGKTENTTVLYKHVHCSPCVHKYISPPCKGDNICMKNISVGEVENAIQVALSKS